MPCFLVAYEQVQQALRAIQLSASLKQHESNDKGHILAYECGGPKGLLWQESSRHGHVCILQ